MVKRLTKFCKSSFVLALIFSLIFLGLSEEAFAKVASRGLGEYAITVIIAALVAPFLLIYALIVSIISHKKNRQNQYLLEKLSHHERSWEPVHLRNRIEVCFLKVEDAWSRQNANFAKQYMSDALCRDHTARLNAMKQAGTRNVLKQPEIKHINIVEVTDHEKLKKDFLWAHLHFSMIDYTINTVDGSVIEGESAAPLIFDELWKFIPGEKDWVVDEINKKVDLQTIQGFKSVSGQ